MANAVQRPAARRDLLLHYVYLGENAGLDVAKRFRACVESTYANLALHPDMGAPGKFLRPRHRDIRLWPVSGFPNYLIAYRPYAGGVAIERLMHAKQDYRRVLR